MSNLILFWHRRDLRTADNLGLWQAQQQSRKVVGVFCLDPDILERDDIAPVRVVYMLGCLQALQQKYMQAGSQLIILQANPIVAIPTLATALQASTVGWNLDVEPYAQSRDRAVSQALAQAGIAVQTGWDQLLHAPDAIRTQAGDPYTVYTPFWKNWQSRPKAEPMGDLTALVGLSQAELEQAKAAGAIALPSPQTLGFIWDQPLLLAPGEVAALEQLEEFCQRYIQSYDEQRNFPSVPGTSMLSAALKFGVIGIRTLWAKTVEILAATRSDEARTSITTWRQELAWREFYQHVLFWFPKLADGPYRQPFHNFPWVNNLEQFQAWCEGRTGYPIVDAAMRQLNQTGWMHNRCRMIVASFLTKDLIIDWRWGEKYFMQTLMDGDLSANNGGWQWSASSGMDPKPLRIFNPASQAQKFDPEADYIRTWVPELRSLDTADLVTGKIAPFDRHQCGYPQPIVDHNQQQKQFKALYQQVKSAL